MTLVLIALLIVIVAFGTGYVLEAIGGVEQRLDKLIEIQAQNIHHKGETVE